MLLNFGRGEDEVGFLAPARRSLDELEAFLLIDGARVLSPVDDRPPSVLRLGVLPFDPLGLRELEVAEAELEALGWPSVVVEERAGLEELEYGELLGLGLLGVTTTSSGTSLRLRDMLMLDGNAIPRDEGVEVIVNHSISFRV